MSRLSIFDIADYFIWYGKQNNDYVTQLKLQKLCFLAEAFHLAIFNKPLTGERFEAWARGPVSRNLWNKYKDFKWMPIINEKDYDPLIDNKILNLLKSLADTYYKYSAETLERWTHAEGSPWSKARGVCRQEERCTDYIDPNDMTDFYKQYVETG